MSFEIDESEVFIDTCVLLNYVQQWLEEDRGSVSFFEEHPSEKTISETVEEEFSTRCDARSIIYLDMVDFLVNEDEQGVEHYKIEPREPLAGEEPYIVPSDRDNVREIQFRLVTENRAQALRLLREYIRAIDTRRKYIEDILSRIVEKNGDEGLKDALARIVSNTADQQVLSDAVGWCIDGGTGTVTTQDGVDILSNRDEINEAIVDYHSSEHRLDILSTEELVANSD